MEWIFWSISCLVMINLIYFLTSFIFFFTSYKYYSSKKNIESKDYNRSNIDQILKKN